ncbi:MAG: carbonic anhydrase, partial [Mycobacteriaceae bacterium]
MTSPRFTSPEQAWSELLAGNERFVNGSPSHPRQDPAIRESLASGQAPFATVFHCGDSRVASELIFDAGLGDIFVVRNAGHVVGDSSLGSLEFGVGPLQTPVLVVLGHHSCGAVTAAAEAYRTGEMPGGFIRDLVERILPSVMSAERQGVHDVNGIVAEHVRQSIDRIMERSALIHTAV